MKLFSLIKNLNCRVLGTAVLEITGLYHKDTEVKEGGLFFCLHGTKVDGTNYVYSAIKNGAVAVVTEQELGGITGITQIIVKNAREAMSLLACKFYGNPASKLKIIGVTGTNGKTTITHMIAGVLKLSGKRCGIIGTNGVYILDNRFDSGMTTPDPVELQQYLQAMVRAKIEYVCMEVSAHALDLFKLDGIRFEVSIFTNLTEDHLDYFKTIQRYFEAKSKLFQKKFTNFAVLNIDDEYGKRLAQSINIPFETYSIKGEASLSVADFSLSGTGSNFTMSSGQNYSINMAGSFNISNAAASVLALRHLGMSEGQIASLLGKLSPVDGRFNSYSVCGATVVIDYAHTPDGLKKVLEACREIAGAHKLISVFGCGGNRETQKRSIMGEISSNFADFTVITSDNPRFEAREKIAAQIEQGMKNNRYIVELDRARAIERALDMSEPGDVVLLAGKGAEPYIDECGVKIPYSDRAEIEKYRRH